ncbi:MAG: hypothetical protein AAGG48_07915 [Planctomycetota bacterium]
MDTRSWKDRITPAKARTLQSKHAELFDCLPELEELASRSTSENLELHFVAHELRGLLEGLLEGLVLTGNARFSELVLSAVELTIQSKQKQAEKADTIALLGAMLQNAAAVGFTSSQLDLYPMWKAVDQAYEQDSR